MANIYRQLPIYEYADTTTTAVLRLLETVSKENKDNDLVRDIRKSAHAILGEVETGARDSSTPEELMIYLKNGEMRAAYTYYLLLMSRDLAVVPDNELRTVAEDELDTFLRAVRDLVERLHEAMEMEKREASERLGEKNA